MTSMGLKPERALALRSFAFERLSGIAAVLDDSGVIVDTNEAWRLFAQLNDGTVGTTGTGVSYLNACDRAAGTGSEDAAIAAAGLRQILGGERERFDFEYPCPSPTQDRWFMLQASSAPVATDGGVVLFHVDITARKALENRLATEAEHDELTGLPNRRAASRFLEDQLARSRTTGDPVWVLFLDLDGFKGVNDTHGHHVGDELLVQVAARARRAVRDGDVVCRFGGDELFFVCPGIGPTGAAALATRLREVMSAPFQIGSAEVVIGASVGCAPSTVGATVDSLLSEADALMYSDKRARRAGAARSDAIPRSSRDRGESGPAR